MPNESNWWVWFLGMWVLSGIILAMIPKGRTPTIIGGGGFLGAILATLAYAFMTDGPEPSRQRLPLPPVAVQVPEVLHYYSFQDGTNYGYEPLLTQQEIAAGQMASTMMMARFLGIYDGVLQVLIKNNGAQMFLECQTPCEVVKIWTLNYQRTRFEFPEYMRLNTGMLLTGIVTDAAKSRLDRYEVDHNGAPHWMRISSEGRIEYETAPVKAP